VLVAIIALGALLAGDAEPSRAVDFTQDEAVPLAILGGAGLAFYALIVFEDSVNVAEEAKDPYVAILFTTAIAFVLIATGDLSTLADMTVLLLLLVFAVVNVAVLVLRRDHVDHDHFRIPTWVPLCGFVISFAVMTTKEGDIFLRAAALLAVGAVLYAINRLLTGPRGPFATEELEALKG
jgi:amino acid transporter